MPRVHTQKAGKDYPSIGVKKGETYYWWKFRYRSKSMSKTYPKRSQLTQSGYLQTIYELEDQLSACSASTQDELQSFRDDLVSSLEELRDEQEEKRNNMPEQLQDSSSGEMLQERYDALDNAISELESVDLDDYDEPDEDEIRDELAEDITDQPTEKEEDDDDFDLHEWKKAKVDDTDVQEKISEKLQEWLDDKISELTNVSFS